MQNIYRENEKAQTDWSAGDRTNLNSAWASNLPEAYINWFLISEENVSGAYL